MTTYYVDTSAPVKRYVDETGSGWLCTALGTEPSPSIIIVHLAVVDWLFELRSSAIRL